MTIEFYKGFSVITKHINWKILTKNLLLLKDWIGLRMKNYGGSLKNPFFFFLWGEFAKKAWTVCRFKRGPDKKEGGGVFKKGEGGGAVIPQCIL